MSSITSLRIDADMCTAHEVCLAEAPSVISFTEQRGVAEVLDSAAGLFESHSEAILAAAEVCPMSAVLVGLSDGSVYTGDAPPRMPERVPTQPPTRIMLVAVIILLLVAAAWWWAAA